MSDRSDELTESREDADRPTEDVLAETEELLSGTGTDRERSSEPTDRPGEGAAPLADEPGADDQWWRSDDADPDAVERDAEADSSRLSRLVPSRSSGLLPSLSIGRYFSPKAFVALVLLIGFGLLAGQFLLPMGGRIAGMAAVAFLLGLVTSQRRYLEMTAAGVLVGGVAALVNHAIIVVAGSTQAVIAVGATAGLVATVAGYYFGRDLRNGLSRDVE